MSLGQKPKYKFFVFFKPPLSFHFPFLRIGDCCCLMINIPKQPRMHTLVTPARPSLASSSGLGDLCQKDCCEVRSYDVFDGWSVV